MNNEEVLSGLTEKSRSVGQCMMVLFGGLHQGITHFQPADVRAALLRPCSANHSQVAKTLHAGASVCMDPL